MNNCINFKVVIRRDSDCWSVFKISLILMFLCLSIRMNLTLWFDMYEIYSHNRLCLLGTLSNFALVTHTLCHDTARNHPPCSFCISLLHTFCHSNQTQAIAGFLIGKLEVTLQCANAHAYTYVCVKVYSERGPQEGER